MNDNETTHATSPLDGITAALEKALHQASQQAEQTINDARKEADAIISDAREQAERIINDAKQEAERITDSAQADARSRDDMERASLAIQEHAAALHTLALGLTGRDTTPQDNDGDTNGGADDDSADSSGADNTDSADDSNENTNDASTIPPAPTVTYTNNTANTTTPTNTSHANTTTTRRADGTTRKLAPWEQPQDDPAPDQEETHVSDSANTAEHDNEPERADTTGDATAPTWDAPLIIDAPLQL